MTQILSSRLSEQYLLQYQHMVCRHRSSCASLRSPVSQVAKAGENHVGDGAEVLRCFVTAELHEDQLFVSDVRWAAHHQSSFLS